MLYLYKSFIVVDFMHLLLLILSRCNATRGRSTQRNPRPSALSFIGLEKIMDSIELEFSHAKHVGLAWLEKNNEIQPNSTDEHLW